MPELQGQLFPPFQTSSGFRFSTDSTGRTRYFTINTDSAIKFFEGIAIRQHDITANMLGLYGFIPLDGDLKARFATLTSTGHLWRKRENGCVWSPNGSVRNKLLEFDTCPIIYMGEECPDALYNTCFEKIFGAGNKVRDLMGSPEGEQLVMMMLNRIFIDLGNGFSELVHYANNPIIEQINSEGTYRVTPEEWKAYYTQQMSGSCGGLVTLLDQLRAEGEPGHTVPLPDGDFDDDDNFTGAETGRTIEDVFNALIDAAGYEFRQWIDHGVLMANGQRLWPTIKVTSKLYRAYENHIRQTFPQLLPTYNYMLTKSDGTGLLVPNALRFNNMAVTRWDEVGWFDNITGAVSHRAAIFAPGVLGVAHDVDDLKMFKGMGMQFIQRLDDPWMGKIFMSANLRWGAGIGSPDFITQAANITIPAPIV